MSHPNPHHDSENEYPSDHYKPHGKRKSLGGHFSGKAAALKKRMEEVGGRFTKK